MAVSIANSFCLQDPVAFSYGALVSSQSDRNYKWVSSEIAKVLGWLAVLQPLCQDLEGFSAVKDKLMDLVALVMDPCESLQDSNDVASEERPPRLDNDEDDFDWTGLVANDPKVSVYQLPRLVEPAKHFFEVRFLRKASGFLYQT